MSGVFELRQYTLHPGQRDTLLEMFERLFIEAQEAAGARVIGHFLDANDPDRFIWFRGFTSMAARPIALSTFYDGPVWQTHRNAANATMIDSDDVLLLRLVEGSRFPDASETALHLTIFPFDESLLHLDALTLLQTEHAANNYPRLPVRENENVIVALTRDAVQSPIAPIQHTVLHRRSCVTASPALHSRLGA